MYANEIRARKDSNAAIELDLEQILVFDLES